MIGIINVDDNSNKSSGGSDEDDHTSELEESVIESDIPKKIDSQSKVNDIGFVLPQPAQKVENYQAILAQNVNINNQDKDIKKKGG